MKQQGAKAGLWLLMLAMGGTTVTAAQISHAPAFSSTRSDSGRRAVTIAFSFPKAPAVGPSQVAAVESSLPDAPSAVAQMQSEQDPSSSRITGKEGSPRPPASVSMGPAFLIANGAMMGSTIANAAVISNCRPTSCKAVPSALRSPAALYGVGIPVTLGVSYVSYRLKRSGTKLWILPVAVVTVGNFVYALNASKWSNSTH